MNLRNTVLLSDFSPARSLFNFSKSILLIVLCLSASQMFAEGTKQVSPTDDDWAILALLRGFAGYNTSGTDNALCLDVLDDSEEVYIALSQLGFGDNRGISTSSYEYRIVDSVGSVVHGPYTLSPSNLNGNNYADVVAGPDLGSGTGYDISDPAFHFSPPYKGRFCIEFKLTNLISPSGFENQGPIWWDFTVTNAAGTEQPGRLFSKKWSLRTVCGGCSDVFSQPFSGKIFVLTEDGFVHKIDFENSGFRGLTFDLGFNQHGPGNTGDFQQDRRSVNGVNANNPQFKVFLNDPDPLLYSEPKIGALLDGPDFSNPGKCDTLNTFCFEIEVSQPGSVEFILDMDGSDSLYTAGTADLILGKVFQDSAGLVTICIDWDGKDGLGNQVDLNGAIPSIVNYTQGEIHFMMYDVEYNNPGFKIEVIHPASATSFGQIYYDDSLLSNSDNDTNLDMDNDPTTGTNAPLVELNGCKSPCHTWNRNTDSRLLGFGESNTINSWWQGNLQVVNLAFAEFCAQAGIAVEKSVTNISNANSGTEHFNVSFEILIENTGGVSLENLQLTDDMVANFGSAYIGLVQGPVFSAKAGTPSMPNPAASFGTDFFNGISGELKPGDILQVDFTIELNPKATGSLVMLSNQATASGENSGTMVSDLSDDILDLTGDDDPTLISFPKIGLAKRIATLPAPAAASGEPFSYDLTYEFIIENLGDIQLTDVSLKDLFTTQLNSAFTNVVGLSILPSATTTSVPGEVNTDFSGAFPNEDLLNGGAVLNPGERLAVQAIVEIEPHQSSVILTPEGNLENTAVASANGAGIKVTDISDTGTNPSDDNAPEGTNPGANDDAGGTDDPTLFKVPLVNEICNNNIDDDGDGQVDCFDNDCGLAVSITGDCSGFVVVLPEPDWTFQWYKNGNPIAGAVNQNYLPGSSNEPGGFSVRVESANGCQANSPSISCCNPSNVLMLKK